MDCGGERGGDLGVADTEERGSRAEEEEARRIALFRYRSGLGLRAWGLIRLKIRASGRGLRVEGCGLRGRGRLRVLS